ncbi:MAG: hypothetical protein KR126chlam1_00093 [Chlamydiae bacterium]|nr:hypothetical protein [Chlamydiota bacterium]
MKQRKWDNKTKAKVVLDGLKGKPIAEICNTKNTRLKAKRTPSCPKHRAERPNQFWGIDMTPLSRAGECLQALEVGIQEQFKNGVRGEGFKLVSDSRSLQATITLKEMPIQSEC